MLKPSRIWLNLISGPREMIYRRALMGKVNGRACDRCCTIPVIDSMGHMMPEKKNAGMKMAKNGGNKEF